MFEIGRLVVKTAGRDAGKQGVIVDILDNKSVLVDGNIRRRRCNVVHLLPLDNIIKISKGAKTEDVLKAMKSAEIKAEKKKVKRSKKTDEQRRSRKETTRATSTK